MSALTKKRLIGVAVVLVLLLLILFWALPRGPGKEQAKGGEKSQQGPDIAVPTGPKGEEPPDEPEASPAAKPDAEASFPHIDVGLGVNLGIYAEVVQGTPLLLAVTLCHLEAQEAERLRVRTQAVEKGLLAGKKELMDALRSEWQERLESLPADPVKLRAAGEGVKGWVTLETQSNGKWSEAPWNLEPLGTVPTAEIELGAQCVQWEFALSPESARSIEPGDLTLRARLTAQTEPKSVRELVSRAARVKIVTSSSASPETRSKSTHLTGLYYLGRGDFTAAERSAREVLSANPKRAKSWVLLGRAKEGQGDKEAALEAYQKVIDLIAESGSKEPPSVFVMQRRQKLLWGDLRREADP